MAPYIENQTYSIHNTEVFIHRLNITSHIASRNYAIDYDLNDNCTMQVS